MITSALTLADLARQKAIEEKLQCKFIRFNVDEGNVISNLMNAYNEHLAQLVCIFSYQ